MFVLGVLCSTRSTAKERRTMKWPETFVVGKEILNIVKVYLIKFNLLSDKKCYVILYNIMLYNKYYILAYIMPIY